MLIEATKNTPYVNLDLENYIITFYGKSYPEHPICFFKPIFDEMSIFLNNIKGETVEINLALEIINSVSSKYLYILIKEINEATNMINVNWYYEVDDEDMEEEGYQFIGMFKNIKFKLIPLEDIKNFTYSTTINPK